MVECLVQSAIRSRINNDHLEVTYSWLQKKFNLSPIETEDYLKAYLSQCDSVIADYFKISVDKVEHTVLVSLKPSTDSTVSLTDYEVWGNESNNSRHSIICEDTHRVVRLPHQEISDANIPQNNCHISPKKSKIESFIPKVEKTSMKNDPKSGKPKNIQESMRQQPVKSSKDFFLKKSENFEGAIIKTEINDKETKPTSKTSKPNKKSIEETLKRSPLTERKSESNKSENIKNQKNEKVVAVTEEIVIRESASTNKKAAKNEAIKTEKPLKRKKLFDNFGDDSEKEEENVATSSKRHRIMLNFSDSSEEEEVQEVTPPNKEKVKKVSPAKKEKTQEEPPKKEKSSVPVSVGKRTVRRQVERTFMDEDGFLVTQTVTEEVVEDGLEVAAAPVEKRPVLKPQVKSKALRGTAKVVSGGSKGTQTNLMSFFTKKA